LREDIFDCSNNNNLLGAVNAGERRTGSQVWGMGSLSYKSIYEMETAPNSRLTTYHSAAIWNLNES